MRVKVFDGNDPLAEPVSVCDLAECFPDNDDYLNALDELRASGRLWVGGGAAALFLLVAVRS